MFFVSSSMLGNHTATNHVTLRCLAQGALDTAAPSHTNTNSVSQVSK